MKHGSLFSGIGGFDLAATWMGWENVFHCERDVFCRRILKYYWPESKSYEDIRQFNAVEYRGQIDVLSGGFPCQPFSVAGKRKGMADDRYLWPQMLRIIGEIQPRWVVGENVFGLLNWNRGLVFRTVLVELEAAGYEVWPYVLPAAGVGAPHRRDRIWFVAHACSHQGGQDLGRQRGKQGQEWKSIWREFVTDGQSRFAADSNGNQCQTGDSIEGWSGKAAAGDGSPSNVSDANGIERREGRLHPPGSEKTKLNAGSCGSWDYRNPWEKFPTESPVCGRDDGLPAKLDNITFSSWRRESVKAFGNAIVPKVALQIFKAIDLVEKWNAANERDT